MKFRLKLELKLKLLGWTREQFREEQHSDNNNIIRRRYMNPVKKKLIRITRDLGSFYNAKTAMLNYRNVRSRDAQTGHRCLFKSDILRNYVNLSQLIFMPLSRPALDFSPIKEHRSSDNAISKHRGNVINISPKRVSRPCVTFTMLTATPFSGTTAKSCHVQH